MKKFVKYKRVSTINQGDGLGIAAQNDLLDKFIVEHKGVLVGEFTEIESAGVDIKIDIDDSISLSDILATRPKLMAAIRLCIKEDATLLLLEGYRLTRSSLLLDYLLKTKVRWVDITSPNDTPMMMKIKTAFGEEILEYNRLKTQQALDRIKKNIKENGFHISKSGNRITKLGSPANIINHNRGRKKAAPSPQMSKVKSYVMSLRKNGLTLETISVRLNSDGYRTPKNCMFTKGQISRLLK
jgi:hypothetical protein